MSMKVEVVNSTILKRVQTLQFYHSVFQIMIIGVLTNAGLYITSNSRVKISELM